MVISPEPRAGAFPFVDKFIKIVYNIKIAIPAIRTYRKDGNVRE